MLIGRVSRGDEEGEVSQGRQEKDFDRAPRRELNSDIQTKGYLLIGHYDKFQGRSKGILHWMAPISLQSIATSNCSEQPIQEGKG